MHTFPAGIVCIATVRANSNVLWAGLVDGSVWRTDNALAGAASTWMSFSSGLPTARWPNSIAVDPFNPQRVAVGYSGVSGVAAPNRSQHVYLTTNNGMTWMDASGTDGGPVATNLPDLPVYAVAIDPSASNRLLGIAWSGSLSLLATVGLNGVVLTSPDGNVWTAQASDSYNTLTAVTWAGTQFVAVGLGGTIFTSPDGIGWMPRKTGPSGEALQGVAWSGVRAVVTSASMPDIYVSPDGKNWTKQNAVAPRPLLAVRWSGSQFVAVGYGGTIVTSPDGLTWTPHNSQTTQNLTCVVWSGSQFVAAGNNGTILTSPTGTTWTPRVSPTTNQITGLAWSGSQFVGVTAAGEAVTSPNGSTWKLHAGIAPQRLLDVTWTGSLFVAVGDLGTIVTSHDGLKWADGSVGAAPFALIAGTDTAVLYSINSGATWQILGVGLPNSACMTLALDWTRTPSLLRVGVDGRSVFELTTTPTPRVAVISNLAFGHVKVGSSATLAAKVFNVGSVPLNVTGFVRISGSTAFTAAGPGLPLTIPPGTEAEFTLKFQPPAAGDATAGRDTEKPPAP
jgi:hypothetical protein